MRQAAALAIACCRMPITLLCAIASRTSWCILACDTCTTWCGDHLIASCGKLHLQITQLDPGPDCQWTARAHAYELSLLCACLLGLHTYSDGQTHESCNLKCNPISHMSPIIASRARDRVELERSRLPAVRRKPILRMFAVLDRSRCARSASAHEARSSGISIERAWPVSSL